MKPENQPFAEMLANVPAFLHAQNITAGMLFVTCALHQNPDTTLQQLMDLMRLPRDFVKYYLGELRHHGKLTLTPLPRSQRGRPYYSYALNESGQHIIAQLQQHTHKKSS